MFGNELDDDQDDNDNIDDCDEFISLSLSLFKNLIFIKI